MNRQIIVFSDYYSRVVVGLNEVKLNTFQIAIKIFVSDFAVALPDLQTAFLLFQSIPSVLQVQLFNLRSRPRRPSQEMQAGLDARVIIKAPDIDDLPHFLPPMMLYQLSKHHFQRDTVKRIFVLLVAHILSILQHHA